MSAQGDTVAFELAPVPFAQLARLERELGVSHVLAQVLARRGLADPAAARAFLSAEEAHSPRALRGIGAAVELVLSHLRRGSVITVHGDYDCDGVCSTAILVSALRELGADVDWYLPDRLGDGYGLSPATVERLASRGTRLLITADCAITAIDAVAAARSAGLDVLVTDHHAPRADGSLPDAPIVHPALCAYPCEHLCATAVAMKLAQALRGGAGLDEGERPDELELVALATVADVVPLLGENRRLVRDGLRALSRTGRIGLRSLMAVAQVDPLRIGERQLAFALAPRINAAGRIARADVALELLLTDDPQRAAQLAAELDRLNGERRNTETRIRFEAEAQVAATGPAAAYVLAGEGWHPGVVGIVAARIAERHHRPAVLVADAVLDPLDRFQFALHRDAMPVRQRDHFLGLRQIVLVGQPGGVEQHRVPSLGDAFLQDLTVRAVVQVQRRRNGHAPRHFREHNPDEPGAHLLHGLHRNLHDDRRPRLLGRGQHGVHRQVVDDVERSHSVTFLKGIAEDLLHRNYWHVGLLPLKLW